MKVILIILSYILTPIYYFFFGFTLLFFQVVQWLFFNLGGYSPHKKSVDVLNLCLMRCLNILGTTYKFNNQFKLPTDKPIIFVSNHQSMYDISPLVWHFKKHHPKFVSKRELERGVPSISYNLRHGGSVSIDRKNPTEAVELLNKFGKYIETNNYSAAIFPEGSRSKDGKLKPFKTKGLKAIVSNIPSALIVPVTVNNTWKINYKGNFPLGLGTKVSITIHEPILANSIKDFDLFLTEIRNTIEGGLVN